MNQLRTARQTALIVGTLASAAAGVLGLVRLVRPGTGTFYLDPQFAMLSELAGPHTATTVQAVAGLIGVAAGISALVGILPRTGLMIAATTQVLVFGVALQSPLVLNTAGYLLAAAMPVIGVILLVQLCRRYPRARWLVGCPILIGIAVGIFFTHDHIARLVVLVGRGLLAGAQEIVMVLLFAVIGFCWVAVTIIAFGRAPSATSAVNWVVRHRVMFTLIAAGCLVPYGFSRLTWFTPWPLFGGQGIDMPTRIWGIALGSGAWLGLVLTLGLIRPWGEVFPRWMPGLAGRGVPVLMAAIPGGAVAAVVCAAAIPWLYAAGRNVPARGSVDPTTTAVIPVEDPVLHAIQAALVIPCWLWGPTLALAVLGYVGHRMRTDRGRRQGEHP